MTTTNNTLAPSDAELHELTYHHYVKKETADCRRYREFDQVGFARAVLAKWGAPAHASQPVAVPAGVDPVARIEGIDEYGPRLEWMQHWVDVGVGAKLFTAAQVQAMLTAAPSGPARERQDEALIRQMLEALESVAAPHVDYAITAARLRLDGKP